MKHSGYCGPTEETISGHRWSDVAINVSRNVHCRSLHSPRSTYDSTFRANKKEREKTREKERSRKGSSIRWKGWWKGRKREREREREKLARREEKYEGRSTIHRSTSEKVTARRRRMGTHFFDLMNIDSFQQEAIDIDRRQYVSPCADIKLSFHGDRASFSSRDMIRTSV